ncbi:MAG: RluA family pseudouridine synthase [Planctomycetes bacterium]|nr:RluA family pseudouridine synthase [Planctomycetota bacterium]
MFPPSRDLSIPCGSLDLVARITRRERLDLYLLRALGWKSRARVQKLIHLERVSVNDAGAKPAQRVANGDRIRILLTPGGEALLPGSAALPPPLWEDPYLLCANKPAGRLVHPVGRAVGGTILNEIHARYRGCNARGLRHVVPKLCHRLDRDTSGVLLIAKNTEVRRTLQRAFESDRVHKEYLAVVHGAPSSAGFDIDLPIGLDPEQAQREGNRLAKVAAGGRPALTRVRVLLVAGAFSVVRCDAITGRQNQIRAHLAACGHPILGDAGYGSSRERWSEVRGVPTFPARPLLHSALLRFPHPLWGYTIAVSAPPPPDFAPFLVPISAS